MLWNRYFAFATLIVAPPLRGGRVLIPALMYRLEAFEGQNVRNI